MKEAGQQAGKNFAWLTLAQAGVRVLGLAFYLYLASRLSAEGVGQYNFIGSFVPFWFIVIDFGAGDFLFREWTRGKKDKGEVERDFNILFTVRFCITAALFVPFLVINHFINPGIVVPLGLFYVSMFIAMFLHLYDLYLQSDNLFRFTATRQIIEKTVMVFLGGTLLFYRASLTNVFYAILAGQIISALYYYKKITALKVGFVFDFKRSLELFKKGLPFLFIAIFASLYARIDMTMLRYMKDFETVGWYGAAYKFLDISSLFSVLFLSSIFPILSNIYSDPEKRRQFWDFYYQSFRIIFSAGVLIALSLIFLAPFLISWFFAGDFGPSVLALRILMIAQVLMFLSLFFNNLLVIQGKEKKSIWIIAGSATANLVLNFVLIPKFSLYGAAWATVFAEVLNLVVLQYVVEWKKDWTLIGKMVLVFLVNAATLYVFKVLGNLNNLFFGAALLLTNILVLFTLKLLQKRDLELFLSPIYKKAKSLIV